MPIFSSLGSLTYNKVSSNQANVDYWILQSRDSNTDGYFSDFHIDTSNNITFVSSTNFDLKVNCVKLMGNVNPVINFNKNYSTSGANVDTNSWSRNVAMYNGNVVHSAYGFGNNIYFSPYRKVGIGERFFTNADGDIYSGNANNVFRIYPPAAGTAANSLQAQLQCTLVDGANSALYYGINYYNYLDFTWTAIQKYNSIDWNPNLIIGNGYIAPLGNGLTPANSYISGMNFTSDGNLVALSTIATANTSAPTNPRANVYLYKKNTTPITSNLYSNALQTIWYSNIAPSSAVTNNYLRSTGISVDNNITYYSLYNQTTGYGYLVKHDANGNLVWQKQIANLSLMDTYVKTSNDIYTIGIRRTSSNATAAGGNLWIAKFDNTGNIVWQNEMNGNHIFCYQYDINTRLTAKIECNGSNLYIGTTGGVANTWNLLKIPDDGNIPGNGIYQLSSGNLTYTTSNLSTSAGNLYIVTVAGPIDGNVQIYDSFKGSPGNTTTILDTSRNITFIS